MNSSSAITVTPQQIQVCKQFDTLEQRVATLAHLLEWQQSAPAHQEDGAPLDCQGFISHTKEMYNGVKPGGMSAIVKFKIMRLSFVRPGIDEADLRALVISWDAEGTDPAD